MKKQLKHNLKNAFILILLLLTTLPVAAHAQRGVGGGDLCKNEIDKHRVEIQGWIERDEAKDLDFSQALAKGLNYSVYKKQMLSVLAYEQVIVTCYLDPSRAKDADAITLATDEKLSFKSIMIGSPPLPTTCINYRDSGQNMHIDCNYEEVMKEAAIGDPDYRLTHHEFASLAGIEQPSGSYTSDFSLSDQLSEYEHLKLVKVLGPRAKPEKQIAHGANGLDYIFMRDRSNLDLGEAWRDPSGVIWGDIYLKKTSNPNELSPLLVQPEFNHDEAEQYCKSIGAELPSIADVLRLRSYMGASVDSNIGFKHQVLPHFAEKDQPDKVDVDVDFFLSGPAYRRDADHQECDRFDVDDGTIKSYLYNSGGVAVRCVKHPTPTNPNRHFYQVPISGEIDYRAVATPTVVIQEFKAVLNISDDLAVCEVVLSGWGFVYPCTLVSEVPPGYIQYFLDLRIGNQGMADLIQTLLKASARPELTNRTTITDNRIMSELSFFGEGSTFLFRDFDGRMHCQDNGGQPIDCGSFTSGLATDNNREAVSITFHHGIIVAL